MTITDRINEITETDTKVQVAREAMDRANAARAEASAAFDEASKAYREACAAADAASDAFWDAVNHSHARPVEG